MLFLQDPALLVHNLILSAPYPSDPRAEEGADSSSHTTLYLSEKVYLRKSSAFCVSECAGTHARIIIIILVFLHCEMAMNIKAEFETIF